MSRNENYNLFMATWVSRACLVLGVITLGYLIYEIMANSIEPAIIAMIGIVVAGLFGVSTACGSAAKKIRGTNL